MNKDLNRIVIITVVLAVLTVVFRIFNLDMALARMLYNPASGSWKFADNAFVLLLYRYGTYPAIILAAISTVVFTFGFVYANMKKYRKAALLIMLTMLIGPGLVTNVILKNYSGRPRPRDVKEFGGKMDFRQPLETGVPGRGFSFPCGHCTMGFFFYTAYLILRKKKKAASYTALCGAAVYGTAMGFGRMAQGGHFASDVIWAAGITFLTAELLHVLAVKTDQQGSALDKIKVKNKLYVYAAAVILLVITAGAFLIATPFNKVREYTFPYLTGAEIISNKADISVGSAEKGSLKFRANGFGLPWSDYDDFMKTDGSLTYLASSDGFFSEMNSAINADLAAGAQQSVTITATEGNISYISGNPCKNILLNSEKGSIEYSPLGATEFQNLTVYAGKGNVIIKFTKNLKLSANAVINISAPRGKVLIQNSGYYFQDLNNSATKISGSKELRVKALVKDAPELNVKAKDINVEILK